MSISRDEVRRIARLAHLEFPRVTDESGAFVEPDRHLFDDSMVDRLALELGRILDHVAELRSIDVRGIEATSHGVVLPTRLRKDDVAVDLDVDRALAAAPARVGNAVSVPKIVE